ncbi:hypothetical protein BH23BAC1_BH23BAC1_42510 [soil metagenome]
MKRNLLLTYYFFFILAITQISAFAASNNGSFHRLLFKNIVLDNTGDTTKIKIKQSSEYHPENPFSNTISQSLNFDLKAISKRKFSISFLNKNPSDVKVKIYDVIGNLIVEDKISSKGYFYKEYDLSFYNTDLFIIEVGNSKYNKTKSLVAG